MSFILDALKKSESERQQRSSAEFAAVPTNPGSRSVPRWLMVVGLLLAVNLLVLVGLLMRPNATPEKAVTSPAAEQNTQQQQSQPSFVEQIATVREQAQEQQTPASVPENTAAVADTSSQAPAVRPVLISQNPGAIPVSDLYPTIQEVRASGLSDLPDLHLDIHVYSTEPQDRFVFINMAKLREGSQLDQGPVVVEITADGVILEYQRQSFLLPRE